MIWSLIAHNSFMLDVILLVFINLLYCPATARMAYYNTLRRIVAIVSLAIGHFTCEGEKIQDV